MYIIIYTFQSIKFVILGGLGKKTHPSTCIPICRKPPFPLRPIFFYLMSSLDPLKSLSKMGDMSKKLDNKIHEMKVT